MCPTSAHFFEATSKNPLSGSDEDPHHQEVYGCQLSQIYFSHFLFHSKVQGNFEQAELINMAANDNDAFGEVCETTPATTDMSVPTTNLLGIDELLETVRSSCSQNPSSPFFSLFSLYLTN